MKKGLVRGCDATEAKGGVLQKSLLFLVDHFQPELECARIKGTGHVSEIARTETSADALTRTGSSLTGSSKLRMVPGVEALRAEFNAAAARFAQDELLKQGEIPVVTAGTTDGTVGKVPP